MLELSFVARRLYSAAVPLLLIMAIILLAAYTYKRVEDRRAAGDIALFAALLVFWLLIRIVRYDPLLPELGRRYLWYLFYFPMLLASAEFFRLCSWHTRNNPLIRRLRGIFPAGAVLLALLVLTNDLHGLAFRMDEKCVGENGTYEHGIVYFLCYGWVISCVFLGIIHAVPENRKASGWRKAGLLFAIFGLGVAYSVCYILRLPVMERLDFSLVYSTFFLLGFGLVLYREHYEQTMEEQLYQEIYGGIRDKTIEIYKRLRRMERIGDYREELAVIKLLVGYCKRKSSLIIAGRTGKNYMSRELVLLLQEMLADGGCFGIMGVVRAKKEFVLGMGTASDIYAFFYNVLEYAYRSSGAELLLNMERSGEMVEVRVMVGPREKSGHFEPNGELSARLDDQSWLEITEEGDVLNLLYRLPVNRTVSDISLSGSELRQVLKIKANVHDVLGMRLSLVSRLVEKEDLSAEDVRQLTPLLKNIIDDLGDDGRMRPGQLLNRVQESCRFAGAQLYVTGTLPHNEEKAMLLVKVIRECATNSIRHGNAGNIYVEIAGKDRHIRMVITDDGKAADERTAQSLPHPKGTGLRGIRSRILEQGGTLEVKEEPEFTVTVML